MNAGQVQPESSSLMVYARSSLNRIQQHNRTLEEILVLLNGSDISPPTQEPPENLQGLLEFTSQELQQTEGLISRVMLSITGPLPSPATTGPNPTSPQVFR